MGDGSKLEGKTMEETGRYSFETWVLHLGIFELNLSHRRICT